jgi:glycosyltransferase involved in cell wall biosynthesis
LWTLFTHETSQGLWSFEVPAEIGPVSFGHRESSNRQGDPRYALWEWRKAGRIIDMIRREGVRAVVVLGYNDVGRVRIVRWCRRHGIPCFVWGDSNILGDRASGVKRGVKNLFVPWLMRQVTGALACGSLGRAYFEKYGVPPERIFLFTNEPDYDLIRQVDPGRLEEVRRRFGLAPDRRRLVYSGRLVPAKRVDQLIDAFLALADQRPEWDLVIVGDGVEAPALRARVPEALRARVTFTGFLGQQADVSALYRLSDVLVLPSDYEPWALVINEAVAAGLAVVSSSVVGAAAELVRDGVNGLTYPAGDLPALVDRLLDVTRPGRADTMKSAAAGVLADWRRRADPIEGMRQALRFAGILANASENGSATGPE